MEFLDTALPGVLLIQPDVHRDARGFFLETWHAERYEEAGIPATFVQDNLSRSSQGTLRGMHAQTAHPQGKLIHVLKGEIFDVAVDIRVGSPTFAEHVGVHLSSENQRQLWVPVGFAHGFQVLSDVAEVAYKCTDFYDPSGEVSFAWDDPDLGIRWPRSNPLLSDKDRGAPPLRDLEEVLPRYHADGP